MLKAGTIILLVLFILTALYSLVDIIAPRITLEGDFQAIAGRSFEGVLEGGSLFVPMLYLRHLGVASLAISIAAAFILLAGFSKAQRWAWWALLVTGGLVLGFGTVVNLVIANWLDFATHLVALLWLLAGLLIPVKVFFTKRA
ncbi:MAG TPA: hypothetical protein VMU36_08015 [Spirochaetia bacterium]|nr:hypothetical protein [Spirochaetia bacterium]